ncbi:MAG: FAD-dependent oxidoreductase [Gammaproteobacteria bacterium]|nr:FAD-dependent oxidoreductase [Gammaproteobacteria bacterium]
MQYDVTVIGGGVVGASVAMGLARKGLQTVVLDEGDMAYRASRGNFGLVWVQSKGAGCPDYAEWTRCSAALWPHFAQQLQDEVGIDVAYRQSGGLDLCFSEQELAASATKIAALNSHAPSAGLYSQLDRNSLQEMIGPLGSSVVGAGYSPLDGDVNPLKLLQAMHAALQRYGGDYQANCRVANIERRGDEFVINIPHSRITSHKIVLAAGLGNISLGAYLGLDVPIRPLRGQILVSERMPTFLSMPTSIVRQTEDGTVLMGDSKEDVGFDDGTDMQVASAIAQRGIMAFPQLAATRIIRCWGALRIMTRDGLPLYANPSDEPGVYILNGHSAVTLAAVHSKQVPDWIAGATKPPQIAAFGLEQRHVC